MIRRLYVHNFRCFENFELLLEDMPSVLLIGKNGAGKSTVFHVFHVLQQIARGTSRIDQLLKSSDFSQSRSDVPMRFELEALLQGELYRYVISFELAKRAKEVVILEESLKVSDRLIYERTSSDTTFHRAANEGELGLFIDWHLAALPILHESSQTDSVHIFKTWLARMLILAPVPSQITGESEGLTLEPNRDGSNFGEWITGLLASSPLAYTHIDSVLKDYLPDLDAITNPLVAPEARQLTVQFKVDGDILKIPFKDLSDGEKCMFICAVSVAANRAYGPLVCFWDEPDNHVSLAEVGMFITALRRSFEVSGQLIVTSHDAEAVRRFSDQNTFVLSRKSHLEPTTVRRLSEVGYTGDLIDSLILDTL